MAVDPRQALRDQLLRLAEGADVDPDQLRTSFLDLGSDTDDSTAAMTHLGVGPGGITIGSLRLADVVNAFKGVEAPQQVRDLGATQAELDAALRAAALIVIALEPRG